MTTTTHQNDSGPDYTRLVERVAARDRLAFETLYGETAGRILAIILRLVGDRANAEDILQNVYVKVWNRADRFDSTRGNAMAWLTTMSRNEAIDWLRKHRKEAPALQDPDAMAGAEPGPRREADLAAERDVLAKCLTALPDPQQSCIRLAFLEGLTHGALAERLATPLGTVKARIRRGIARLKRCLEGEHDES